MKTRKDLIKNIAIVFLSVMLILTFFSNTILNWSLSQVKGKYTDYGEIKTGVRGSGTVQSSVTFSENIKGNRTVESVHVNRGMRVEEGDLLMVLSVSDKTSLETLEAELVALKEAYNRALLAATDPDYTADELAIEVAEEELADKKAERALYTEDETYISEAKKEALIVAKALENATAKVAMLEAQITAFADISAEKDVIEAREAVEKQTEVYNEALAAYEKAKEALDGFEYDDVSSLEAQKDSPYSQLDSLERELGYLNEDNADLLAIEKAKNSTKSSLDAAIRSYNSALTAYENDPTPENQSALATAETAKNDAQSAYDQALAEYEANEADIKSVKRTIEAKKRSISDVEVQISALRSIIIDAQNGNRDYTSRKNVVDAKKKTLDDEKARLDKLTEALETVVEKFSKELVDELKTAKKELIKAEADKKASDYKMLNATKAETLDTEITQAERTLKSMKLALENKKESDKRAKELEKFDLEKQRREIEKKEQEIASLTGNSKEGYELRASRAGTVTAVNFKAGDNVIDGSSAVVFETDETGYTLSFTVSNSDAQKVKVGDTATVSDTYWGQKVGAVLESIVNDAGGKTKTLVFDISGNVNSGQTLTLLVGERSTGYSSVIPKTALREDSQGKFVYITKTKSTPLGNRYVATRLNVNVVAEDDKNVAISTDETYLYEYVIVSSTKPFEEGDYVRLSD